MFGNMKLGHKILTGFLIIIAGTVFIGVFAAVNMVAAAGRFTVPVIVILVCAAVEAVFGIIAANRIAAGITGSMNMIIDKIKLGGEQVVSASSQLSATSQQLADANVEQASSLEEISSTMEETSSMIEQNSENTKQADLLAEQAKSSADLCNTDMQEMITSMNEIKKSSDEIGKIIKVIDEIAFQTNILALNAAVEAARAGDAGMGFAVVAEEVRNLAQRSATAAKDTQEMIEKNIVLSIKGVEVADKTHKAITDITSQVKKVSELMDEITAASQEQAQGAVQINKAISQLEKVTEENAAVAEESAASSAELNAQAESTEEMVIKLESLINGEKGKAASQKSGFTAQRKEHTPRREPAEIRKQLRSGEKRAGLESPRDIIPLEEDNMF